MKLRITNADFISAQSKNIHFRIRRKQILLYSNVFIIKFIKKYIEKN